MDYLNEILDEKEKLHVQTFAENQEMFDAVKKAILAGLYSNGVIVKGKKHEPRYNAAFSLLMTDEAVSNEKAGEDLKALYQGFRSLETAMNSISSFKRQKLPKSKINEAI